MSVWTLPFLAYIFCDQPLKYVKLNHEKHPKPKQNVCKLFKKAGKPFSSNLLGNISDDREQE